MQHLRTKVPRKLNPTLLEYDSVQSQMPTFSEDDPSLNTVTLHSSYGDSGIRRGSGFGLHSATYSTMQSSPINSHTYSDDDILGQPVDDSINDVYVTHSDANLAYGLGEDLGVYSGMMDPRFPPLNLEFDDDEQQQQTGLSAKLERIVESQSPSTISTPRYSSAMKQGPNFVSTMRQTSLIGVPKYDSPFGSLSSKNSSPFIALPRPPPFNAAPLYVVPSPGLQSPGTLGPNCPPRLTPVAVNMVRGGVATTSAAGVRLTRTELPTQVPARAQFARAGLPTQVLSTGYSNNTAAFNPSQPPAVRPCGRGGRGAARGGSTARNRSQANANNVSRLAEAQKDACDSLRNLGIIVHELAGNEVELEADEVLLEADGRRASSARVSEDEDADLSENEYEAVSRPATVSQPQARAKPNRFANADELNDEDDETSEVLEDEEEDIDDVLANGEDSDDDAYSPNRRAPSKRGRKAGTKRKKRAARHTAAAKRARSTNPQWLGGAIKSERAEQFVRPFTRPFEARPNLKSVTKSRSSLPASRGSLQSASIKHEACSSNSSASFANESNSVDETEQKPSTSRWRSRSSENPEEDSTRAGAYQVDAGWRCVVCDRYAADIVGRKNYCAAPERYRLIYYGVPTCKGCQVFFRKTLMELKLKGHPYAALPCASGGGCTLLAGVGFCVACRFNRCVNNFPPPDALKPQRTPEGEVAKMVREKPVLHKVAADEKPCADEKASVGGPDGESRTSEPDAESYSSGYRRNGTIDGSNRHSREAQQDESNSADAEQQDDDGLETLELESVDDDSRLDTSADDCVVRIVEVAGDARAVKHVGGSNQLIGSGLGARDGLV